MLLCFSETHNNREDTFVIFGMISETNSLPNPYDAMFRELIRDLREDPVHRKGLILDATAIESSETQHVQQMAEQLVPYLTNGRPAVPINVSAETTYDDLERIVNEKGVFGIFIVNGKPASTVGTILDRPGPSQHDSSRQRNVPHYYIANLGPWSKCYR